MHEVVSDYSLLYLYNTVISLKKVSVFTGGFVLFRFYVVVIIIMAVWTHVVLLQRNI